MVTLLSRNWRLSTPTVNVSSFVFKRPYEIDHGCNWNGDYYIQSWKLWYNARHHLLLQSIALGIRIHNLSAVFLSVLLLISLS